MVMPFGRHRGLDLVDVPSDYLHWLTTLDLRPRLRDAVVEEVERRRGEGGRRRDPVEAPGVPRCPSRSLALEVVAAGRRVVSKRCHPDSGGSHHDFLRLTETVEWLEDVIGSRA